MNLTSIFSNLARAFRKRDRGELRTSDAPTHRVVARELRRILDDCPICDGGFQNHHYALLATVVMEESHNQKRSQEFLSALRERRWQIVLQFHEWNATKDTAAAFAFRCAQGRFGILTVLSPADAGSPDSPLDFAILSVEEGRELLALLAPKSWIPLRSSRRRHR